MMIPFLISKIHRAVVTSRDKDYHGSISIDREIMEAADLREFQKVEIYNIDNGKRFATYVIPEFPAVAHHAVVSQLVAAAGDLGARHKTGVTWSLDAFYARNAFVDGNGAMTSMSIDGYWPSHLETRIRDMQAANVLNCEMESGITLTLATLFGLRAGCICVVSDRTPWPSPAELDLDNNMNQCIEVANRAMLALA